MVRARRQVNSIVTVNHLSRQRGELPKCSVYRMLRGSILFFTVNGEQVNCKLQAVNTVKCQIQSVGYSSGEGGQLIEELLDYHFGGAINEPLADRSHRAADLRIAFVRD